MKECIVVPLHEYSAEEIKEIRSKLCMTQALFALFMGVSKKTVEAWESGHNTPSGASLRLLSMVEKDPELPKKCNVVSLA